MNNLFLALGEDTLKRKVRACAATVAKLDLNLDIVNELFAKGILSRSTLDELTGLPTAEERCNALMKRLHGSSHPEVFTVFFKILASSDEATHIRLVRTVLDTKA